MIPEFYIDILAFIIFALFLSWRYTKVPKENRIGLLGGAIAVGLVTLVILYSYHLTVPIQAQRLNCTVSYFSVSCPQPRTIAEKNGVGTIPFNGLGDASGVNSIPGG
jgi:hypothetical protein